MIKILQYFKNKKNIYFIFYFYKIKHTKIYPIKKIYEYN